MKDKVLVFANEIYSDQILTGGFNRFKYMLSYFDFNDFDILTSRSGFNLLKIDFEKIKLFGVIISSDWFDRVHFLISYIVRTCYSICYLFLNHNKYKVFYSISDFFPDVLPAFIFKTKSKKWVQVIHHVCLAPGVREGSYVRNFFAYYLQKFSFYLIKKRSEKVIVVSEFVKKRLLDLGFKEEKIVVSGNAVRIKNLDSEVEKNFVYDGVFVGRMSEVKGASDLIKIWKEVCGELQNYKLALVGGGEKSYVNYLEKKIQTEKLEHNIFVLGFLNDEEVYKVLWSSRVFLFPSHEEGWGMAIAEAMACKLPVISWDLPVYSSIFFNNIIKVPENNFGFFAKEVVSLLNDNKRRLELSEKAYNFIKTYNWERVAKKELSIIFS